MAAETRDIVGAKIGMSGRQYDRAKYIADNAPPEVIEQIDNRKRSVSSIYNELRSMLKSGKADSEGICADDEFEALPPEGKIKELKRQLFEERAHSANVETDFALLKSTTGIAIDNKASIIDGLKQQNAKLIKELEAANLRIAELEEQLETVQ